MNGRHMGNMVVVLLIIAAAGGCLDPPDPTPTPWPDPVTDVIGSFVAPGAMIVLDCSNPEAVPCATLPAPAGPVLAGTPVIIMGDE